MVGSRGGFTKDLSMPPCGKKLEVFGFTNAVGLASGRRLSKT